MSNSVQKSIVIDAKIKTTLEGMDEVISKLNSGLRDGITKVDLTKGIGGSLSKSIEQFKSEYNKLNNTLKPLGNDKFSLNFEDSKEAIKSAERLVSTFSELKRVVGNFSELSVVDAKKLFPDAFDSRVEELRNKLSGFQTALNSLEMKNIDKEKIENDIRVLEEKAKNFQTLMAQEVEAKIKAEEAQAKLQEIEQKIQSIRAQAADGITLKIDIEESKLKELEVEKAKIEKKLSGIKAGDLTTSKSGTVRYQGRTAHEWTKAKGDDITEETRKKALEAIQLQVDFTEINQRIAETEKKAQGLRETLANINKTNLSTSTETSGGSTERIKEANNLLLQQAEAAKEASKANSDLEAAQRRAKGASDNYIKTNASLEQQRANLEKINIEIGQLEQQVNAADLSKAFKDVGIENFNTDMLKSKQGLEDLKAALNDLDDRSLTNLKQSLIQMGFSAENAEKWIEQLKGGIKSMGDQANGIRRAAQEMEALKNRLLYFFSATNSVMLFKRAITKAIGTVKELDAVMTETAVVTEFDVGDMWEKLPIYAGHAKQLGSSIKDVYAATTLYYQQGLKTNEAMSVGVETMKMARIANIEAGDATQYMTAALRGFNMEVDETNAERVNDVYSELAAITAADTAQIATAMSKTASIAASANMEFETTAALLAQIIETTQEAPETAGTAMKTIIARFAEVKKLRSEGTNKGEDEEGEIIDVNKIQGALRQVGISMNDFFAGTEGLDSILLKLAERWGDLDFETQRYIATTAAGSRQQSRFIAMMSDYKRTMELATAANNSAGASQKQFDKTLESMEAKLQNLKTAWDEFTMGLANNEILKGAVTALTEVLNLINNLINGLSGGNGLVKSVLSLGAAWGGLKLGGKAIEGIFKMALNTKDKTGLLRTLFPTVGGSGSEDKLLSKKLTNIKIEHEARMKAIKGEELAAMSDRVKKEYFDGATGASLLAGLIGGAIGGALGGSIIAENFDKATETSTEALSDLTNAIDTIQGNIDNTRAALENIEPVKTQLKDYQKQLKTLSKGTAEYYKTLSQANSIARDMIDSNLGQKAIEDAKKEGMTPTDLYGYQDGWLQISEAFYTFYEQAATNQLMQQENQLLRAESKKSYASTQERIDSAGLNSSNITEKEQSNVKGATIGAGAGAGAIAGIATTAAAGITYGSLAGPIGAIVGLVAGVIVGGITAAIGESIVTQGNKDTDYMKLYKQLGQNGAEIKQSDVDEIKTAIAKEGAGFDMTNLKIDDGLKTALANLREQIGDVAFESLIGAIDGNTIAINENTQKYIDENNKGLNGRQQEFANRLNPSDPGAVWTEAGILAASWSDMDIYNATQEELKINEGEYNFTEKHKKAKKNDAWRNEVNQRAKALGLGPEEGNYVIYEDGMEKVWNGNGYVGMDSYKDVENTIKTMEAEEAVLNKIVAGELVADYNQVSENSEINMENDYTNRAAMAGAQATIDAAKAWEIGDVANQFADKKHLSDSYDLYEGTGHTADIDTFFESFGKYKEATATGKLKDVVFDQATALSAMLEKSPEVTNEVLGEMGLDYSELYNLMVNNGLIKEGMVDYNAITDDNVNLFYDYFRGLNDAAKKAAGTDLVNAENAEGAKAEGGLWDSLKSSGLDFGLLWEEILSFDSGILETEFSNLFSEMDFSNLGEEQTKQLQEAMSNLELSDLESLRSFFELLSSLGLIKLEDPNTIVNYVNKFSLLTGAIEQVGKITVTTAENLSSAIEKLQKGEALSEDEYNSLIEQNPEVAGSFIKVGDQYYLSTGVSGNVMAGVIETGMQNTLAQQGNKVESGRLWEERLNNYSKIGGTAENNLTYANQLASGEETGLSKLSETLFMTEMLNKVYGLDTEGMDHTTLLNNFQSRYNEDYGENGAVYQGNKTDYQGAAIASGSLKGLPEIEATNEVVDSTLTQIGTNLDIDPQSLIEYKNHLMEVNTELTNFQAGLIAQDFAEMSSAAKTLSDNWDDWTGSIKAGKDAMSQGKEAGLDYYAAINNLKDQTAKLLNIQGDLSEEFVITAKESGLLEKAIKGDQKAMNELQKMAAKDLVNKDDLTKAKELFKSNSELMDSFASDYDDLADLIAETDLSPGEIATGELASQLQNMYDQAYLAALAGGASVEQAMAAANAAMNAEGFEPPEMEMQTVEVTGTLPDGWTAQPDGSVMTTDTSGKQVTVQGAKITKQEGETYTYTMTVPKVKGGAGGFTKTNEKIGGTGSNSGGGGGGGGSKKEKWENPYDEFYNVVEDINEELRTREKLERRYQALLDKTGTKASDLVKNAKDQINSLEKQKKLREGLLEGRTRQMSDIESEYSDLSKYAWYNEQDGTIEIDWEKINALDGSTNEKLTSRIEEYIKKLEEQQDLIEQEEDELEAIEETLREIRDQGKDEYFDFEEQIKDALIDQRQKEIDKLSAINDSINDTNSRLIDAMQSSIDKYRQDRENERTEEELSDKQRRLAYLQQDTSGANALEIMQLQEEIDQGMEDYTDQLIDQKINELQEQNDEAAEQREKQIAIAEAQLKKWEESGEIWNNVYELMSSGIDEDGIVPGSELQNLLKEAANFEGMSKLQKMDWLEELENNVGMAIQWLMVGNSTEALISKGELSKGQQITFTTSDGDEVTGILQDNGDVIDSQGNVYTDVYRDQEGNWVTEEETKGGGTSTGGTGDEEDTSNQQQTNYPYGKASEVSGEVKYGDRGKKVKAVQWALKKLGYSIGSSGVDGIFGNDTLKAVKKFQRKSKISADGVVGKNTKKAFKLKQYASGGLADFTGPAWLDGTKSKPEYILNAEQTKSFFKLVDILSGLKSGTNQSSQITGDSIYDVDINVESIGSDYDVEKLATTIKRMINDDARYRNNNAINLQR